MFEFHWPWMALLLFAPLLVRYFWLRPAHEQDTPTAGRQTTLLHPSLIHLQEAFQTRQPRKPLSASALPMLLTLLWPGAGSWR